MPAEARVTAVWKRQKSLLAVFLGAMSAWFFYDGAVGYPFSNQRWEAYQNVGGEKNREAWKSLASSRNWSATPPHKFFTAEDIRTQFVFGTVTAGLAVIALGYWAIQRNRILKMDEEAVITPTGIRVPFEAITRIDAKRWEAKGLATFYYQIDGRRGKFILDDYKFQYTPTHRIFDEIQRQSSHA